VYGVSPVATAADIDQAYRAASHAFETWARRPRRNGSSRSFRIADAMESRAQEFADLESQDTGKPRATLVADEIMQSWTSSGSSPGRTQPRGPSAGEYLAGHTSFVRREPIGVVGQSRRGTTP
jgi:betaine-aldehyde dehydrogenase